MSKRLTPADRQRLSDSLRRIEEGACGFFHSDVPWDSQPFPAHAASRLKEMARVLMAEAWHLENLEVNGG